jgi:hypothetical protein
MTTNIRTKLILALALCLSSFHVGCASRTKEVLTAGILGAAVGAGLGYAVVHHGRGRRYVVPNTIITSSLTSLAFAGLTAYHYRALDRQKISFTSRMGRTVLLESDLKELSSPTDNSQIFNPDMKHFGAESVSLDENTRWVLPTFRKRHLQPEAGSEEFLSSRYTWEIVRPGFFENIRLEREELK